MIRALPLLLLAACGADLPPAEGTLSAAALAADPPVLVPLDEVLVPAARPSGAAQAGLTLRRRGAGLAARAVPRAPDQDLAARGRALRDRAEALRTAPLD